MADEDKEITHQDTADSALSSANGAKNKPDEEMEHTIKESDSGEQKSMSPPQLDHGGYGDYNKVSSTNNEPTMIVLSEDAEGEGKGITHQDTAEKISDEKKMTNPEEDNVLNMEDCSLSPTESENKGDGQTGGNEIPETTTSPIQEDRKDEQIDGPKAQLHEELSTSISTNTGGVENVVDTPNTEKEIDMQKNATSTEKPPDVSVQGDLVKPRDDVKTIGSITQDLTETESPGGSRRYLIALVIVIFVAILVQQIQPETPPQIRDMRHIEIFRKLMDKVKTQFPHQRDELWNRSRVHLQRHLQTAQPTEPVSLILTAGLRAQRTLRCLAQALASAFSSARNASDLLIDGASVAGQDSDRVKLYIDRELQGAFEGNTPVAVVHRFEELPPASTLIFYRYCDHENAAYKNTFLLFTVLLGEEEIPAKIHLGAVEEMVDDHLQKKFLSHDHPVSFDRMDRDKYGGLWSRISHLILPVASEERIEHEGCE